MENSSKRHEGISLVLNVTESQSGWRHKGTQSRDPPYHIGALGCLDWLLIACLWVCDISGKHEIKKIYNTTYFVQLDCLIKNYVSFLSGYLDNEVTKQSR